MKRRKYGNRKVEVHGIKFDSAREGKRYTDLLLLQRAGEISDLELQPRFKLMCGDKPILVRSKGYPNGRHLTYVADFAYTQGGKRVIEDSKGARLPAYKIKLAIMEAMGYRVRET